MQLPSNMTCGSREGRARAVATQAAEDCTRPARRFLALWGADDRDRDGCFRIYAAYLLPHEVVVLEHAMQTRRTHLSESRDLFPGALRMERATYDLLGIAQRARPDKRGWLRHGGWPEAAFPLRRDVDRQAAISARGPSPIHSSRWKAMECTKSLSARSMRAPSSQGTSASPSLAKKFCDWKSASAIPTRESRSDSRSLAAERRPSSGGARLWRFGRRLLLGILRGAGSDHRTSCPPARSELARPGAGARADCQSSGRSWALSATTLASPSGSRNSRA